MINLSRLNPFRKLSADEMAVKALEEARCQLLNSQAQAEYHSKMTEYFRNTVSRLSAYTQSSTN